MLSAQIFYLVLGYYAARHQNTTANVLVSTAGAMTYMIFGNICYPGSVKTLYAMVLPLIVGAWLAFAPIGGGLAWSLIYTIVLPFGLVLRYAAMVFARQNAKSDFRFLTTVAPMHIARHATGTTADLYATFKPRERRCVCLSSDWRNYQQLSSAISAEALGLAINAYYDTCQMLLRHHLPTGNYYTDWIADEFFIVIYAEEESTAAELVDKALQFACNLIIAKQSFAAQHGLPKAIDIGISYGTALLGLMGPLDHQKATALGAVPGRARRLQSVGKSLRFNYGERDRIIFGRDCLMELRKGYAIQCYDVQLHHPLRDLSDQEIYFLDPITPPLQGTA